MNTPKIFTTGALKGLGKVASKVQTKSPEILIVAGVAGVVTAAVLAAKSTLKLEETLDRRSDERLELARRWKEEYEEEAPAKLFIPSYIRLGKDLTKLYGPAILLGAASIGCIVGSHGIMHRRNVGLVAAYKVLESGFNNYRERVVEEYGEEKDHDFFHDLVEEERENEKGEKETVKVKKIGTPVNVHTYARFFDEENPNYNSVPEFNLHFLRAQQNYFNDILQVRGHVFLNEVYDALGMERSSAGAVTGWTIGEDGDNYIDFNIYDPGNAQFVNGLENTVLLDFNVDGVIVDKI